MFYIQAILKNFYPKNEDVSSVDINQNSVLHLAAFSGKYIFYQTLAARLKNVYIENCDRQTPVQILVIKLIDKVSKIGLETQRHIVERFLSTLKSIDPSLVRGIDLNNTFGNIDESERQYKLIEMELIKIMKTTYKDLLIMQRDSQTIEAERNQFAISLSQITELKKVNIIYYYFVYLC